ncbi:hypothetical protein Cgig2_015172 [Carnegiea gigantea]|uniref:PPM-type phosphatase domain-containing protein n=1 Tax=Carnegiea gigantea TaxID=171969 RepID=A0A9Q1QN11_9CARY|nr:hypothetical protein Cgig2_015172 [Carnegiea gigantea]
MGHWSSMFNGLARSFSIKKVKNSGNGDAARETAEAMARDAKKNDLILKSSGIVNIEGSKNFATLFTKKGQKGVNQDCCIVWEEFGCQPDMIFCGIFDGHGPWGHFVAKMVRESMPPSLLCNWQETLAQMALDADFNQDGDKKVEWFNIWKHSYLKTCAAIDQELEQHRKIDAFYSGTTALSIVKQGERIIIANVGDSRAVLATTSDNGDLVAVQLTIDFKPNLPHLLQWFGGRNEQISCVVFQVWDVISNQEAVEIVSSTPDRAKAAKRLVDHAARAWKRKRRGIAMDDISAICLFFHSCSTQQPQLQPDL